MSVSEKVNMYAGRILYYPKNKLHRKKHKHNYLFSDEKKQTVELFNNEWIFIEKELLTKKKKSASLAIHVINSTKFNSISDNERQCKEYRNKFDY